MAQEGDISLFPTPPHTRLAELLAELAWSPNALASASRVAPATVRRALRGEQTNAKTRMRILGAINVRRAALHLPELSASEVFPAG